MLNLVREGEEDYIEAIRYRRRLKIFENFLLASNFIGPQNVTAALLSAALLSSFLYLLNICSIICSLGIEPMAEDLLRGAKLSPEPRCKQGRKCTKGGRRKVGKLGTPKVMGTGRNMKK